MAFDSPENTSQFIKEKEEIEETKGSLESNPEENKLMRSVMDGSDQGEVDIGKVLSESMSRGMGQFTPDIFFQNIVENYKNAERLYGDTLIREVTGYDSDFIRKNLNQPEFKRELKDKINKTKKAMDKSKVIDKEGNFNQESINYASLIMLSEELEKLETQGIGPRLKEFGSYGNKFDIREFRNDSYKNIAVKQTVKTSIRRMHKKIEKEDFRAHDLVKHGRLNIVYCLDTSGSMKGNKLSLAKKAGIALTWKSLKEKNNVGLVTFNQEVIESIPPNKDLFLMLEALTKTKAGKETSFSCAILEGVELLKNKKGKKHILLVTDGNPTKGNKPIEESIEAASIAKSNNISVSIVGIELEKDTSVAEKIVELGNGNLYNAKSAEDIEGIVIEDYYTNVKSS